MVLDKKKKTAIASALIYFEHFVHNSKKKRAKRTVWQKKWLAERSKYSDLSLLNELRITEPDDYKNYLRMDSETFDDLLLRLKVYLTKKDTRMRKSIPPEERLIITLRFLATGRSFEDLKFSTGISPQALGYIIPETCKVIFDVLKEEFLKFPATKEEWLEIAKGFEQRWQIPNCGGAIDGKHIRIWAPKNSGALYYNYKHFYSMVLMGIVNANYEFVFVDVGKNGRISDGGILQYTSFYQRLIEDKLSLPENHDCTENLNFVFIGDEAFALHRHMLKPFSQNDLTYERRVYNYRLSRGRNVVENVFGLITSRFRVLHTALNMTPLKSQFIVLAICTLHNYLIKRKTRYIGSNTFDSENKQSHEILKNADWRQNNVPLCPLQSTGTKNYTFDAKQNRNDYLDYFNGRGQVDWQHDMLKMGKA